jgi:hypothetical protein
LINPRQAEWAAHLFCIAHLSCIKDAIWRGISGCPETRIFRAVQIIAAAAKHGQTDSRGIARFPGGKCHVLKARISRKAAKMATLTEPSADAINFSFV